MPHACLVKFKLSCTIASSQLTQAEMAKGVAEYVGPADPATAGPKFSDSVLANRNKFSMSSALIASNDEFTTYLYKTMQCF